MEYDLPLRSYVKRRPAGSEQAGSLFLQRTCGKGDRRFDSFRAFVIDIFQSPLRSYGERPPAGSEQAGSLSLRAVVGPKALVALYFFFFQAGLFTP